MQIIRAIKDKSVRYIMLGIAVFALLFLLVIGISLFVKAFPIMKEKNIWILLSSGNWRPFKGDFGRNSFGTFKKVQQRSGRD